MVKFLCDVCMQWNTNVVSSEAQCRLVYSQMQPWHCIVSHCVQAKAWTKNTSILMGVWMWIVFDATGLLLLVIPSRELAEKLACAFQRTRKDYSGFWSRLTQRKEGTPSSCRASCIHGELAETVSYYQQFNTLPVTTVIVKKTLYKGVSQCLLAYFYLRNWDISRFPIDKRIVLR